MPGLAQSMTLDSLDQWAKSLGLELAALNFTRPLQACAVAVKADVRENFDGSHAPDGSPWAALRFPRVRGGAKPLMDRGLLAASFSARGQGHIEKVTPFSLEVGTADERAALMNDGGTVRPTSGQFLAIPKTKAALRAGRPRNWSGAPLVSIFGKKGGVLIERQANKRGKRKDIVHYALVRAVTIPARPFAGFSAKVQGTIDDILLRFLESQVTA